MACLDVNQSGILDPSVNVQDLAVQSTDHPELTVQVPETPRPEAEQKDMKEGDEKKEEKKDEVKEQNEEEKDPWLPSPAEFYFNAITFLCCFFTFYYRTQCNQNLQLWLILRIAQDLIEGCSYLIHNGCRDFIIRNKPKPFCEREGLYLIYRFIHRLEYPFSIGMFIYGNYLIMMPSDCKILNPQLYYLILARLLQLWIPVGIITLALIIVFTNKFYHRITHRLILWYEGYVRQTPRHQRWYYGILRRVVEMEIIRHNNV